MPISQQDLEARLRAAFPSAEITVKDLAGDNDHWSAKIVDEAFRGLPRVRQHQLVYQALGASVGGEIHALQLETSAPAA
jgi:stress-induced morphogen